MENKKMAKKKEVVLEAEVEVKNTEPVVEEENEFMEFKSPEIDDEDMIVAVKKKSTSVEFKNPSVDKEDMVAVVSKTNIPTVNNKTVRVKFLQDFPDRFIICGRIAGKKGEIKNVSREQVNVLRKRNIVA
jgi:hypothetical protein